MAISRREFVKAAGGVALAGGLPGWAARPVETPSGPVRIWTTQGDQRHAAAAPLAWKPAAEIAADAIVLDPRATMQEILGFGAAMTDAACYVLSHLNESERAAVMHEMFAPEEMAFNVCRTCIGASDYSKTLYSYDESEKPDPELMKFSIEHDKAYILPALKDARKINPQLFLFSSPWSPPGWMKSNGSMLGGAMRKQNYQPYAKYFHKFLQAYGAEGVRIDAVTVQNEVDTDQDGRMPACLWGQEYEVEFVRDHLGPLFKAYELGTKIWVLDHNYNLWGRAVDELSDTRASQFIDGIAWHGYVGDATAMTQVHDAFPEKHAYWTEGGPDIKAPDYATDWARWADTFAAVLNNWARSITAWNLALDEKGNPNIGPFSCGGLVTIDNATHNVTRSGQYWAFAHFCKHVKRGARVFATDTLGQMESRISHVGFRNPDRGEVLVLANTGRRARVQVVRGTMALELEMPPESVYTLEWAGTSAGHHPLGASRDGAPGRTPQQMLQEMQQRQMEYQKQQEQATKPQPKQP